MTGQHTPPPAATDLEWQTRALCADDPDWHQLTELDQKRICIGCPVHAECLTYALANAVDDPSIWGGYGRRQRDRIRRQRAAMRAELAAQVGAA